MGWMMLFGTNMDSIQHDLSANHVISDWSKTFGHGSKAIAEAIPGLGGNIAKELKVNISHVLAFGFWRHLFLGSTFHIVGLENRKSGRLRA